MRYLSVCSGIEAASAAWHSPSWTPVAFAEIDPFCTALLQHHYPSVPNLGDFTRITPAQIQALGGIDLFVGGTPCQGFSVAGARGGLEDSRGNLTLEFCRLAHILEVPWVCWENVPGVFSIDQGRTFAHIIGLLTGWEPAVPDGGWRGAGVAWGPSYALAWRVLDAQHFGVPQRRRRIFLVAQRGSDWRSSVAALWHINGVGDWCDHALHSPLSLLSTIGAYAPVGWRRAMDVAVCHPGDDLQDSGGCVTLRMAETPAPGPTVTIRLGDVLETTGPHLARYALSPEACRGILARAARRGKQLPPALDAALQGGTLVDGAAIAAVANPLGAGPQRPPGYDLDTMTYIPCAIPILEVTARMGEREVGRAGLGIGAAGTPMYTLEATKGHGVAHTLTTEYDASPDGTGRGVPIIPACEPLAFTHQSGTSTNQIVRQDAYAGALSVTRQDAILAPIAFDSMSGADAVATYVLRSSAASNNQSGVLAYTIQTNDGGTHRRLDRPHGGMYVRETDAALTVGTTDQTVITFAEDDVTSRTLALRGRNGATHPELGDDISTAIRSDQGGAARAYVLHDAGCEGRYAQTREELAFPLRADTGSGGRQVVAFAQNERAEVRDLCGIAGALAAEPGAQQQTYVAVQPKGDGRLLVSSNTTAAITTADHSRWDAPIVAARMVVRRLTPLECERLQGFPDGYTNIPRDEAYTVRTIRALAKRLAKRGIVLDDTELHAMIQDGPRYRALGNSMAVPCMAWVGQAIERARTCDRPIATAASTGLWRWRSGDADHADR